jgi:hypothetical protein
MRKIMSDYLDTVCAGITDRQLGSAIRAELTAHLRERFSDLTAEGKTEDEAAALAVAAMGDANELTRKLNAANRSKRTLLLAAACSAAAVLLLGASFMSEATLAAFFSPAALIVTLLLAVALSLACTARGEITVNAFCRSLSGNGLISGGIVLIVELSIVMGRLDTPEELGPSVAVAVLAMLYGFMLSAAAKIAEHWTAPPNTEAFLPKL